MQLSIQKSNLIRDYMTPAPRTIGFDQSLEQANLTMRELKVRHLPVLKGGKLIGIVSDRDISLLLTFAEQDALNIHVEEALAPDLYFTTPNAPLSEVVDAMAKKKFGSAIVMDGSKLVGIFTAIDALHALSKILKEH